MAKTTKRQSATAPLGDADLYRLRARVKYLGGEAKAHKALGVPRDTLVRALAGAALRPSTAALLRTMLVVAAS